MADGKMNRAESKLLSSSNPDDKKIALAIMEHRKLCCRRSSQRLVAVRYYIDKQKNTVVFLPSGNQKLAFVVYL